MARKLTNKIINAAIEGFEAQKSRIDQQIAELRGMLSGDGERHSISAAGRARIAEAQRQRWAALHEASEERPKPKRRLSPAGRKAIQDALRRWAAKRAKAAKAAKAAKKATTARKKTAG